MAELPVGSRQASVDRLSPRQVEILRLVRSQGRCAVASLAERLQVSEETVRRDVRPMAVEGIVQKLHGAVTLPEPSTEPPLRRRMLENADAKRRIARLAAAQIEDGEPIMLDTGSTTIYVARELAARRNLVSVTNSSEAARALAAGPGAQVFLSGGVLRADDGALFGPEATAFVGRYIARTAILSIGGIDLDHGLLNYDVREAEFARAVIERVDRLIVVADRTKFGRRGFARVCGLERIDLLVTDAPPVDDIGARLQELGVTVLVAAE